jgi:prepilin-type N-terminal cleavage/methylation domain-containing protein
MQTGSSADMKNGEVFLMTKHTLRKPGVSGFSLVEVLIVLAMAAILSAFAVPALTSAMRDMQLMGDARNIASALNNARLKAASLMNRYRVSFDVANNQWRLEKFNSATNNYDLQQDVYELSTGLAGSGITFTASSESHPGSFPSSSSNAITFNSLGIPIDGANLPTSNNIIYLSKSDMDYAVTVTMTGKVQVWRNDDGQWSAQ